MACAEMAYMGLTVAQIAILSSTIFSLNQLKASMHYNGKFDSIFKAKYLDEWQATNDTRIFNCRNRNEKDTLHHL